MMGSFAIADQTSTFQTRISRMENLIRSHSASGLRVGRSMSNGPASGGGSPSLAAAA